MKIGVIGTGVIASAMVTGFCDWECEHEFILSPRNAEKSAALAAKYPNCTVAKDNQDVLDRCEAVILAVVPQKAEEILSPLNFRREHKVISLIPVLGLEKIGQIIGETEILVDVLPLPFIRQRIGPVVINPPCKEIEDLIRPLGDLIALEDKTEMAAMRTITALMSPFYELCYAVTEWGMDNSLSEPASKMYTTSFFKALSIMAGQTEEGKLKELAEEMTPGGLNWQATNYLKDNDAFHHWQIALDAIMERVTGVKKEDRK